MSKIQASKQQLIDAVIEKIKEDISDGDVTALDELLGFVDSKYLIGFLPEEEWEKYR